MIDHENTTNIRSLIELCCSSNPDDQKQGKYGLIAIGTPAVPALIEVLKQSHTGHRREAAAILGEIGDPSAIPALIDRLADSEYEVRWRAAESLAKMKRECLIPLLEELRRKERFSSQIFLDSAHHVLRLLNTKGYLGSSEEVLKAYDSPDREEAIPWAAERVLETLRK